jgi:indolepyruvate ferredoxin oxidoreductase
VGIAWQKGLIPLGYESMMKAIELNGVDVKSNKAAFEAGRVIAVGGGESSTSVKTQTQETSSHETVEEKITRYADFLTQYQNTTYGNHYREFIAHVHAREKEIMGEDHHALTAQVARHLFRLMSYKDEYEVARLYTHPDFLADLGKTFESYRDLTFYLAPPLLARKNPATGEPKKIAIKGTWAMPVFHLLAKMKGVRGTWLDIFGYTKERQQERQMVYNYHNDVENILKTLTKENFRENLKSINWPEHIKGYGPIKEKAIRQSGGL